MYKRSVMKSYLALYDWLLFSLTGKWRRVRHTDFCAELGVVMHLLLKTFAPLLGPDSSRNALKGVLKCFELKAWPGHNARAFKAA